MATAVKPRRESPTAEELTPEHAAQDAAAHHRAAAVEARVLRARFTPPERLTVTEWADKYRWLPDTSAEPGKYVSSRAPYQREPMDVIGDPSIRLVVLMWGSQVGKSLVLENAVGHMIHLRPRPMIMVHPKIEAAEGWSKERFTPMVEATPALRQRVRVGRTRDGENTLRYKRFDGGFLAIASANSPAELAARSCARAYCDEVDRYDKSSGTEGDPVNIVERRMGAIGDAKRVLTSTPGNKGESRIEPAYLKGDQRRFYVPCPHCQHMQTLRFGTKTEPGGLRWDKGQPETAAYCCEACACLIGHEYKGWMLERGEWRAENPAGRYPSFHLNALYSPFGGTTWAIIVEMWEDAQGKPEELKVFVNTILAETWEEPGEVVESHSLLARLEAYPANPRAPEGLEGRDAEFLPRGAQLLTAYCDVQDNRLELRVWAWGAGVESWLASIDVIIGDPNADDVWAELNRIRRLQYVTEDGRALRIARLFVDSGYNTNRVYAWCRRRHREGVYASKGVGGEGVPLLGKASQVSHARCLLYPIGVDTGKAAFLRSQLYVAAPGPGYVHLPDWVTVDELDQLTAEKRVTRLVKGRRVRSWVKIHERNEGLDCRVGAYAALHSLGAIKLRQMGIVVDHMRTTAQAPATPETPAPDTPTVQVPPEVLPPEPPPRKRAPQKSSWVGGWR